MEKQVQAGSSSAAGSSQETRATENLGILADTDFMTQLQSMIQSAVESAVSKQTVQPPCRSEVTGGFNETASDEQEAIQEQGSASETPQPSMREEEWEAEALLHDMNYNEEVKE